MKWSSEGWPNMPIFEYKARVKGDVQKSKVEAEDEKAAYAKLGKQGIKPLSVKKERNSIIK